MARLYSGLHGIAPIMPPPHQTIHSNPETATSSAPAHHEEKVLEQGECDQQGKGKGENGQ